MLNINLDYFKNTKPDEDLFRQTYIVKHNLAVWEVSDGNMAQFHTLQKKIIIFKEQGLTIDQVVYVIENYRAAVVRAIYTNTIVLGASLAPTLKGDMAKEYVSLFREWKETVWSYLFSSYFMINDANERSIIQRIIEDKVHEYFEGEPHAEWLAAVEDSAEDLLVVWEIAYRAGLRDCA